ncbi:Linoleate 13S-lipoxygenase 2-1 [Nymphaea thermarum]|nr:Linoleate 13S-lipoxygenase 2-1 [Nymphaea thermarum]
MLGTQAYALPEARFLTLPQGFLLAPPNGRSSSAATLPAIKSVPLVRLYRRRRLSGQEIGERSPARLVVVSCASTATAAAAANSEGAGKSTVTVTISVQTEVESLLTNIGIGRGLDDISDLLGKSIQVELVSSELNPASTTYTTPGSTPTERPVTHGKIFSHRILTILIDMPDQEFPIVSTLDPKVYGPPESAITKELVEQQIRGVMTVEEAIEQKKLFIVDYHDILLPYVNKVRELSGTTLYGSRALFFHNELGTLEPVAIELTRPPSSTKPQWKQAFEFTLPTFFDQATVEASVLVLSFDPVCRLRTHCCTEPYIIAANRQLSAMHPIYRLLHPHFRYTMEINALARQDLINADGIIEKCFSPLKCSIEISSAAYDKLWRFDYQALPTDLIQRGMAVEDPTAEHGLRLVIDDYPFANDGLLIWSATKEWVTDYVNHFYEDSQSVVSDSELQAWWSEVRNKGHADKKDEPWWPALDSRESLVQVLTTIIWVVSGHHAAVNFGQYPYAGYFPNRPTIARTNIPTEDDSAMHFDLFLKKPEAALLGCFPSQTQATLVMAILDVLSTHSIDEEYLGQQAEPVWQSDPVIMAAFHRFNGKGIIDERNTNRELRNRSGAGILPYELLKPFSQSGVTGKGVPTSISI